MERSWSISSTVCVKYTQVIDICRKLMKKAPGTPNIKVRAVPAKYPSSVSAPTSPTRLRPVSNS